MEPERFRSSLLTGGVPVKIVDSRSEIPESAPLTYLMMEPGEVGRGSARVCSPGCRLFWSDWRRFPTLSQEMAMLLHEAKMAPVGCSFRAA